MDLPKLQRGKRSRSRRRGFVVSPSHLFPVQICRPARGRHRPGPVRRCGRPPAPAAYRFRAKGASIGDVFVASDVAFHGRRIPIPVFDLYGTGARRTFDCPSLIKDLNLKGAAVAYVADLLSVPVIFVKAITDLIDGEKPTAEELLQNLVTVSAALEQAVTDVIDFINGKCLSEL